MSFCEDILLQDYILITILPDWKTYVNDMHLAENYFNRKYLTNADGKTNVQSDYHTPYRSHTHVDLFDRLHQATKKEIDFAQEKYRGIKKTSLWNHLKPGECWIAKYKEGDSTNNHVHYPYHLVSTFYYDVEESTPIQFEYYDEYGLQQKQIEVTNGLLIVQNGAVPHSVPQCKGARSVVATNWFYDISKFLEESS